MYWFDDSIPPAIKEAIAKCGPPILLSDTSIEQLGARPIDIKRWCQENLKSFVWMDEQDVSDASLVNDYVYAFHIGREKDRHWFMLRWGGVGA